MTVTLSVDYLKSRLPTKRESFLVFCACVFPIHFWVTIVYLYNFPALILKANIWELIGVLAYIYSFAFIESLLLLGFLIILCFILPGKYLKQRFVYVGTSLALIICISAIISNIPIPQNMDWIFILIASMFLIYMIYIIRRPTDKVRTSGIAERLVVISSLFILLDLVGFIFVFLRQIT